MLYSIVGATVTVHQLFCILHFCHTCSLCHVTLVVQFPPRGSTQLLLCLFPCVLWLLHFLYSVGPHPVSSLHIYTFVVSRAFMAGAASQQETLTSPGHLVSPLVYRGPWMSTVLIYCWCYSDSASVVLYFTFKSRVFILPYGAVSTVPREGFCSSVIMPFSLCCVVAVTVPILCLSTSSVKHPYIHFRCVVGIHGGCG